MIPALAPFRQPPAWQRALQQAITDPAELLEAVGLGTEWLEPARATARLFPLRVPRGYVARMRRGDPRDPLLAQVLPLGLECRDLPGYVPDPVGDLAARAGFGPALDLLRGDPTIREVILSGGDPLTLGDRRLAELLAALERIAHLRRLRLHTRLPIVLPERIDAGFVGLWSALRLQRVAVVHANHASDIDAPVRDALARLRATGTTLLNQAVLLRGVNDDPDVLVELSESLFEAGVLPYYLHVLDPVAGAAHFDVPEDEARRLLSAIEARLPGYLVPALVRESPGAPSKTRLPPASR